MEFATKYKRPPEVYEHGGGRMITEQSGYVPPQKQIEQFILAGKRLDAARLAQFDFKEGEDVPDDVEPDPTRHPSFDLEDATMLGRATMARLAHQAADFKEASNVDEPEEEPAKEEPKK